METKAHHALVGLFTVLLAAALGFFALWLGKVSFDEEYALYDIVFDGPVRGLRESGEVRFNGIQVGEVTELELDDQSRVIARVRVLAQTPVKVDSFAQLEPQGLTGMSYILITGGSPDAQRLLSPPGRQPPKIFARRAQLEGLFEGSEDVLDAAQTALFRLTALLSEQNVEEVSATLANLRTLTEQLSSRDALVGDLQQAVQRIDAAASDISAAAGSLQQFGVTAEAFLINDVAPAVNETTAAAPGGQPGRRRHRQPDPHADAAAREFRRYRPGGSQPGRVRFASPDRDPGTHGGPDREQSRRLCGRFAP